MSEITGTATAPRGDGSRRVPAARRPGPVARVTRLFARLVLFVRQVVAELRKVIWPTRKELVTYTSVVLVFVVVMVSVVSLFDFAFTKAVLAVFGK